MIHGIYTYSDPQVLFKTIHPSAVRPRTFMDWNGPLVRTDICKYAQVHWSAQNTWLIGVISHASVPTAGIWVSNSSVLVREVVWASNFPLLSPRTHGQKWGTVRSILWALMLKSKYENPTSQFTFSSDYRTNCEVQREPGPFSFPLLNNESNAVSTLY